MKIMKISTNISIKKRIYWSFALLVSMFLFRGILINITLNNNRKRFENLSKVVEPTLQAVEDLKKMMLEAKMYVIHGIYLKSKKEDDKLFRKLYNIDYPALKKRINTYSSLWAGKNVEAELKKIYTGFEALMVVENNIMSSLNELKNYDDPAIKIAVEKKIEEDILPRTAVLINALDVIHKHGLAKRLEENLKMERSWERLTNIILLMAIFTICAGIFLSLYMAKVIIGPINSISLLIKDLGEGIIRKIDHKANGDEMGKMVQSVNNLSEKLKATASFAHEVGLRNFDIPFKPLSDDDTLGKALLSMRDNLKTDEANFEIQNKELERKNKELEQFAFVASHDLQEPLRTTSSFVELLQQQYKGRLDDRADKYLDFISQASERMKIQINDLLEYSRIGSNQELKKVDCNVIMNEVLADLQTSISESGAEIKSETLPVIDGYETEMKLLFQNLAYNAIKFRKKGISPTIYISVRKKKNAWQFAFTDNGIGIAREHNERIFIIFQRLHTRNEYKGSGIGLSHCKKIVELHKGKIWLESEVGKGTTFYFTIPQNDNR